MATSSIFSTPCFSTEAAARSLANAIEASESTSISRFAKIEALPSSEVTDPRDVADFVRKIVVP